MDDEEGELEFLIRNKSVKCPYCGNDKLFVDVEYMQDSCGPCWECTPRKSWSVFCKNCEMGNPYDMMVADAKE